jgi:5'-nucleotidase
MDSKFLKLQRSLFSTLLATIVRVDLKSIALVLVASVVALAINVSAFAQGTAADKGDNFTLTIIHTNDLQTDYFGITSDYKICYEVICDGGFGGALRFERAIKALKKQYPDALVMDAGDQTLGTLVWQIHKEKATVAVMNALGYQYFVPGNHEFDFGLAAFKNLVDDLTAQTLAANLVIKDPSITIPKLSPYSIATINGRKVAVIGLITDNIDDLASQTSDPAKSIELLNAKETLANIVKEVEGIGVDIIVLLSHTGVKQDLDLAAEVPGLDIIVGGQSTKLPTDLPKEDIPYPTVVTSSSGDPVLVVRIGARATYLGLLNVEFDEKGKAVKWSGNPLYMDDKTLTEMKAPPIDPQLSNKLKELLVPIKKSLGEKIGVIVAKDGEKVLESDILDCLKEECRSGDAITSAFLDYSPSSQVALVNSGAMRKSLPVGDVTMNDVLATFPFHDYIYTSKITGEELLKVLEDSIKAQTLRTGGGFLQVAGLRVTYQGKPDNYSVKEVQIQSGSNWVPLDPKAQYNLITVEYLARGGGDYELFRKLSWVKIDKTMADIFVAYLKKGPVDANYEPRIIIEQE